MNNMNYKVQPLKSQNTYIIDQRDGVLTIEGQVKISLNLNENHHYDIDCNEETQGLFTEYLFGTNPQLEEININNQSIHRADFYQSPLLWLRNKEKDFKEEMVTTGDVTHPLRPDHFHGTHYKRFVPSLNKTISFRTITLNDLDIFHEWHNQKRVSFYWELAQGKEELKTYIEEGLQKKHQIPMIVEFDGEPVGYYEFYWVKEDRLGPYYEARDYDRGFHFLIGNKRFLGKANTDAITHSGLHFIYLDDPRTKYVMAEPRHDNSKVLKYADDTIGWDALKVFDFPHKRAVLLQNTRDRFFKGARL